MAVSALTVPVRRDVPLIIGAVNSGGNFSNICTCSELVLGGGSVNLGGTFSTNRTCSERCSVRDSVNFGGSFNANCTCSERCSVRDSVAVSALTVPVRRGVRCVVR